MSNIFDDYVKNCSKALSDINGVSDSGKRVFYVDTSKMSTAEGKEKLKELTKQFKKPPQAAEPLKVGEAHSATMSTSAILSAMMHSDVHLQSPAMDKTEEFKRYASIMSSRTYSQNSIDDEVENFRRYASHSGYGLSPEHINSLIDKWGPLLRDKAQM